MSLNVHFFTDAKGAVAFDGVVDKLRQLDGLDVVCLQEANASSVEELARALGGWHAATRSSTAVLSRLPFKRVAPQPLQYGRNFRCTRVTLDLGSFFGKVTGSDEAELDIVSVHLDYRCETTRLAEVELIGDTDGPALIAGDFNALTRADYSDAAWASIAAVRKKSTWEVPTSELTDRLVSKAGASSQKRTKGGKKCFGFVDAWRAAAERSGPLGTSRFDTRIDYIYVTKAASEKLRVVSCDHVACIPSPSDHNAVLGSFQLGS